MTKLSRRISPETLASLATKWGVEDLFTELTASAQKRSRAEVIQIIFEEYKLSSPTASLSGLRASLRGKDFVWKSFKP